MWGFCSKVGTPVQARPGTDRGTLRKRKPAARHPSSPRSGRAVRSRAEANPLDPDESEAPGREARSPTLPPHQAKRKPPPSRCLRAPAREPEGETRPELPRLDGHFSGLFPASAAKGPRPDRSDPDSSEPGPARRARKEPPPRKPVLSPLRPHGLPWNEAQGSFAIAGTPDPDPGLSGKPLPRSASSMGPGRPAKTRTPRKREPRATDARKLREEGSSPTPRTDGLREARLRPSPLHRKRLAAPVAVRQPATTRRDPHVKSPTLRFRDELLASWPPAAGEGQPPSSFPDRSGCSHPERPGIGLSKRNDRPSRLQELRPLEAAAAARQEPGPSTRPEPGIRSSARSLAIGCRWDRKSSPRAAATSERRRSEKEASHLFSHCRSKAQGSNERRRVETPDGAADSTSGARP